LTGLCLVPICSRGCGGGGRCIKPNLCLCDGGKIGGRCGGGGGRGGGGAGDIFVFYDDFTKKNLALV